MNNANLEKRKKFTSETARKAQKKGVSKRKENKMLLDYLIAEGQKLAKDEDGKRRVKADILSKKTWNDAIKKEGQSRKLLFDYLIGLINKDKEQDCVNLDDLRKQFENIYGED